MSVFAGRNAPIFPFNRLCLASLLKINTLNTPLSNPLSPTLLPTRTASKTGSFNSANRELDWTLGVTANATDSAFAITGTVDVTASGQQFQTLALTSSDAGDECQFQSPCTSYNLPAGALAASVSCPYTCTATSSADRTVSVVVKSLAGATLGTQEQPVTLLLSETGKTADVTDTYLQANSNWTATTVTASTNPTTATWTASTPVSCDECGDGNVTNTVTVTSSDAKTATAAFTAPVTCVCSVDVTLSGLGSFTRSWTW
jgi:hypothetical protein